MARFRLKVKEVAETKGFSRTRLSHKTYLAFSTIRSIFRDPYQSITLDTLQKIADVLEVSIFDLLEEVPDDVAREEMEAKKKDPQRDET
jgi:DNA-binding Xre family transcriptional regulator